MSQQPISNQVGANGRLFFKESLELVESSAATCVYCTNRLKFVKLFFLRDGPIDWGRRYECSLWGVAFLPLIMQHLKGTGAYLMCEQH